VNVALDDLIPHRPPARIVERVVSADDVSAETELTVREGSWLRGGALAPEALVEALAQTAAVYAGLAARGGAAPRAGYLAGMSRFEFPSAARPGDVVRLSVRVETKIGDLVAFEGTARVHDREVARGELRVALVGP
jgi:predicted hotdog family 3-hydroxylacyl-ACP dehydratase